MYLKILNRCENYNSSALDTQSNQIDLFHLRTTICDFLLYIRTYLHNIEPQWTMIEHSLLFNIQSDINKLFKSIEKFLIRIRQIPPSIFVYAPSNIGNKCLQPEFHLYHMHLELRWLIVSLVYIQTGKSQLTEAHTVDLNRIIELVISDLIYISLKIFERTTLSDLRQKSPYSCTCVRELWLMLQILIDDIYDRFQFRSFWDNVNATLNTLLKLRQGCQQRFSWNAKEENSLSDCKNPEIFSIWLIYHLTALQGYNKAGTYIGILSNRINDNYDQLEKILKSFSTRSIKEDSIKDEIDEELKVMIPILRHFTEEWWPMKMLVINYLWECFHRRLEQPFLVQLSGPWSMLLEKKTPADLFKGVKDRLYGHFNQTNESSFSMFLRFLGSILKAGCEKGDVKHWQQVKGRIYSKFTKAKLQEFSESALINFITLFLTLATTTADIVNVTEIMWDLLPDVTNVEVENPRRVLLSWKGHLAILLVYKENNLHLEPISNKIINIVNTICCRRDELGRNMMAMCVETFKIIFNNNENFDHGEHNLIGGWMDRYLFDCTANQCIIILQMLLAVFDKIQNIHISSVEASKMLEALWTVARRIRLIAFDDNLNGANYQDVAKLANAFTIEAIRDPTMAKARNHAAPSLFMLFSSTLHVKDARLIKSYVSLILSRSDMVDSLKKNLNNFDLMIIKAWLKCCFHGHDAADNEMRRIKNYIIQCEEFCGVFPSCIQTHEFKESNESIIMYIMALATRRRELTNAQRTTLDVKIRMMFVNFDKWVLTPVKDETKDSDLSYWIYRCLGTFFLACSPIFHTQDESPLKNYLNKFMLPADEQMAYLKQLGKRIVSMVILGLESVNVRTDMTIHRLMIEIFQTYLPLLVTENQYGTFKVSESLIKCFTDGEPEFLRFLIDTLAMKFVKVASDNAMHKHGYLFMVLLSSLLKFENSSIGFVEAIVGKCTANIVEVYLKVHDHHPHKKQTAEFVQNVLANGHYKREARLR